MDSNLIRRRHLWGIIALFTFFSLISSTAHAQDIPPARRLDISPLRTNIEIKQGTTYTGALQLKNTGTDPLNVELSAEAFQVKDGNYDYTFLPNSPINDWVHFGVSSMTLQPNKTYPVKYTVSVPLSTEPGGAYISLFASSLPNADSSIESVDRVGSLLYITIPGDITKTGSLINFSSPYIGTVSVPWSATLQNSGSAHFQSDYKVNLKTLWGSAVSEEKSSSLILPNSVRVIQGGVNSPQWLGLYILHYDISLGDNGNAIGARPFLYLPIGQALILLILIVSAVLFINAHRSRRRKAPKS